MLVVSPFCCGLMKIMLLTRTNKPDPLSTLMLQLHRIATKERMALRHPTLPLCRVCDTCSHNFPKENGTNRSKLAKLDLLSSPKSEPEA